MWHLCFLNYQSWSMKMDKNHRPFSPHTNHKTTFFSLKWKAQQNKHLIHYFISMALLFASIERYHQIACFPTWAKLMKNSCSEVKLRFLMGWLCFKCSLCPKYALNAAFSPPLSAMFSPNVLLKWMCAIKALDNFLNIQKMQ